MGGHVWKSGADSLNGPAFFLGPNHTNPYRPFTSTFTSHFPLSKTQSPTSHLGGGGSPLGPKWLKINGFWPETPQKILWRWVATFGPPWLTPQKPGGGGLHFFNFLIPGRSATGLLQRDACFGGSKTLHLHHYPRGHATEQGSPHRKITQNWGKGRPFRAPVRKCLPKVHTDFGMSLTEHGGGGTLKVSLPDQNMVDLQDPRMGFHWLGIPWEEGGAGFLLTEKIFLQGALRPDVERVSQPGSFLRQPDGNPPKIEPSEAFPKKVSAQSSETHTRAKTPRPARTLLPPSERVCLFGQKKLPKKTISIAGVATGGLQHSTGLFSTSCGPGCPAPPSPAPQIPSPHRGVTERRS